MLSEGYEQRRDRLVKQMQKVGSREGVALKKDTSNLFRHYGPQAKKALNVRDFNHVVEVNTQEQWVEAEGMTPYYDLVKATLKHGVMPTVVPQLRSITIGGAVSGVGIEATSFRYGLVHETVQQMEILLSNGTVAVAAPNNEYRDLFFGFPNSYGTLGYALKLRVKTIPVKKYVHITHVRYNSYGELVEGITHWEKQQDINFLDGVIFSPQEMYLSIGRFVNDAPYTSDYTFENIYYRSIQKRKEDYLTTFDYIWRWDTDWFWCSKNLYMQNPLMRRIMGRKRLNSVTYTKIMRWNSKWKLADYAEKMLGYHSESVIQDVDIPIQNVERFLQFFEREIGITPIWVCPIRRYDASVEYPLFPLQSNELHVNIGFWDVIRGRKQYPAGYYNKKVEEKVTELGGIKSLYSSVFYNEETFWSIYNGEAYKSLKKKYDPEQKQPSLYEAVAQRR